MQFRRLDQVGSHFAHKNGWVVLSGLADDGMQAIGMNQSAIFVARVANAADNTKKVEAHKSFLSAELLSRAKEKIGMDE